jgi:hypothetical protein
MTHSPNEIDFKQYYEDWRHRDNLTWQIPAVTTVIGSGIIIGSYMATAITWCVKALAFGLGAFFSATLTVMLAQNLYYQWRDKEHLKDYENKQRTNAAFKSRPIPPKTEEEKNHKGFQSKLGRILGRQRIGSTLLLIICLLYYVVLSGLFVSTWQWCSWFYKIGGFLILIITFVLTCGWFLKWLKWGIEKNENN